MNTQHPDIAKERSTITQMEDACNRLIAENEKLRKAVKAAQEWARKPIEEGGSIPDFAEDIIPILDDALPYQETEE